MTDIYNMELHDSIETITDHSQLRITKVHGGWIYTMIETGDNTIETSTFVPYTENKQDGESEPEVQMVTLKNADKLIRVDGINKVEMVEKGYDRANQRQILSIIYDNGTVSNIDYGAVDYYHVRAFESVNYKYKKLMEEDYEYLTELLQ